MMKKELLFITVIGKDKKGIVAKISGLLYDCNINIEDIDQKSDTFCLQCQKQLHAT